MRCSELFVMAEMLERSIRQDRELTDAEVKKFDVLYESIVNTITSVKSVAA